MSVSLLHALDEYFELVSDATDDPAIVVPPELAFVPGAGDDLESMIWVITYAIMIHHQESLQGSKKASYKRRVVDMFYGGFSYSSLILKRQNLAYDGSNPLRNTPDKWIPDPAQRKWFRKMMTLVDGQLKPSSDGSIKPITFDAFDALCDEFITEE
jgi:hypothetical protein